MSDVNGVCWEEGMFLGKEHFEQQELHFGHYVHQKVSGFTSPSFGFTKLSIDQQNLTLGKISLNEARGVFPDGTPFDINLDARVTQILELPNQLSNALVYLAVPLNKKGLYRAQDGESENFLSRYSVLEDDEEAPFDPAESVRVSKRLLRLQLMLESEDRSQYSCIPICRILEIQTDDNVLLDEDYIVPVLWCEVSPKLHGYLREIHGMLKLRGTELSARVANPTAQATGAVQDFLLLQLVNRYELTMEHYTKKKKFSPESFYEEALKLVGELATFAHPNKRVADVRDYDHLDLRGVFGAVMGLLRQFLANIVDKGVVPLKIQKSKQGIKVALITDRSLFDNSDWIVAVKGNMNVDTLRTRFVAQTKISPIEKIRDLISSQLSGIKLEALPVAPPELPYHTGFLYFRLDPHSSLFQYMKESAGFAFYLSSDLGEVELECWAIKR